MALLEEQFTEKLQAGASPITYEGNEGREQQIAQALWDKLPPQARMQFGSFSQFFSSGAWKKVLAALQQQMQAGPKEEIQETETETIGRAPQEGLGALMQGPRPMAHGGIMNATPRQGYFVGDIVRAVTKPVKKVLSSDLGKAAALAAATYYGGGGNLFGLQRQGMTGFSLGNLPGAGFFGKGSLNPLKQGITSNVLNKSWTIPSTLGNLVSKFPGGGWGLAGTAATLAPLGMAATGNWAADETFDNLKLKAAEFGFNYEQMIQDIQNAEDEEEYLEVLAKYGLSPTDLPPWSSQKRAEGGRIRAQEGGLMNLGGMEKDYRNDGGFVPIGEYEKKDDVPARLSKNEFVFTADAVRGAGGGDIDKGAEIMENVMKNLEGGGRISEESQGQGARDMFQVSERLSEVV
jgi:hypothetical protein